MTLFQHLICLINFSKDFHVSSSSDQIKVSLHLYMYSKFNENLTDLYSKIDVKIHSPTATFAKFELCGLFLIGFVCNTCVLFYLFDCKLHFLSSILPICPQVNSGSVCNLMLTILLGLLQLLLAVIFGSSVLIYISIVLTIAFLTRDFSLELA